MNIHFTKRFLKELANVPLPTRMTIEKCVFDELPVSESILTCNYVEKLKGYSGFYKIRFGDYRVGLKVERDIVILQRVLHRKEIYRFFP